MGIADFIASRLDPEEQYEMDGPPQIRVTIRLDAVLAAQLDCGAQVMSMTRTGCATRLLEEAIKDMTSLLLERDPEYANLVGPACADAERFGE